MKTNIHRILGHSHTPKQHKQSLSLQLTFTIMKTNIHSHEN